MFPIGHFGSAVPATPSLHHQMPPPKPSCGGSLSQVTSKTAAWGFRWRKSPPSQTGPRQSPLPALCSDPMLPNASSSDTTPPLHPLLFTQLSFTLSMGHPHYRAPSHVHSNSHADWFSSFSLRLGLPIMVFDEKRGPVDLGHWVPKTAQVGFASCICLNLYEACPLLVQVAPAVLFLLSYSNSLQPQHITQIMGYLMPRVKFPQGTHHSSPLSCRSHQVHPSL